MKVKVNNKTIEIFDGAKVKDAVRLYYAEQGIQQPKLLPEVRDTYGNVVGTNGRLLPNTKLKINN